MVEEKKVKLRVKSKPTEFRAPLHIVKRSEIRQVTAATAAHTQTCIDDELLFQEGVLWTSVED